LAFELHEARNLPMNDIFVELKYNDFVIACSTTKLKTQAPYWSEEFIFEFVSSFFLRPSNKK